MSHVVSDSRVDLILSIPTQTVDYYTIFITLIFLFFQKIKMTSERFHCTHQLVKSNIFFSIFWMIDKSMMFSNINYIKILSFKIYTFHPVKHFPMKLVLTSTDFLNSHDTSSNSSRRKKT